MRAMRSPTSLAFLAALALLLAGCTAPAQDPAPDAPAEEAASVTVDEDRPAPTFTNGLEAGGEAVAADEEATLEAPPVLVPGEWWRIRAATFEGETVEYLRVVAAAQDGGYVIGMPHEGWFKEAVAYHSPAFGDVNADLSYDTHNHRFVPVQFPLVDGATWETEFATTPVVATVRVLDQHTAEIVFEPVEAEPQPADPLWALLLGEQEEFLFTLTYDARQHEVVRFASPVIAYEVVEHGYGFEGWVTIPRGEETPIDLGGFAPEVYRNLMVPVEGGFNRLTLMQLAIGFQDGAYRIRTVAPDGTEAVTEALPGNGEGTHITFHEFADPDGDWEVELLTGGVGFTYAMGIAYHQYDVHLPTGGIRSDHSHAVIR